jgi:hypothetical protein
MIRNQCQSATSSPAGWGTSPCGAISEPAEEADQGCGDVERVQPLRGSCVSCRGDSECETEESPIIPIHFEDLPGIRARSGGAVAPWPP